MLCCTSIKAYGYLYVLGFFSILLCQTIQAYVWAPIIE